MFIPRTLSELDRGTGRGPLLRAGIVIAFVALALTLVLNLEIAPGRVDLLEGQIADTDVRAPRSITFVSESQTAAAREDAAAGVSNQYEQIAPRTDIAEEQLRAFDADVRAATRVLTDRDEGATPAAETAAALEERLPLLRPTQTELLAAMPIARWELIADEGRGVLEATLGGEVREDQIEEVRQQVRDQVTVDLPTAERELAGDLAAEHLAANLAFSAAATERARQNARDAVEPRQVTIDQGQTIVSVGDRIEEVDFEALRALGITAPRMAASTIAGNALVAIGLSVLLVAFLWRMQPTIWHRNRSLLLFMLALVFSAIAVRIAADRTLWAFVVPTAATVMLVGILLGGYAGGAMAAALAVIAGIANRNALEIAVFVLAGGSVALLAILRAERLNAFIRAGLWVAISNVAVVAAFSLLEQRDATALVQLGVAGLFNAGLSAALAVGTFAMFGNLFGIMTVFQLLELANPSNRLLRRLLLETPGTYHHSVMVGNLAERAAETIGADPLLARVAAYYHDVGKMKNPLAFIENQGGARNIHDDLSAETSARIISGHIRDGIDLAYEHGLPVQIIGFIPQHHGTSVMSYFYGKALDEVGGNGELLPKDVFRYPGPKPQTREAAILMLADGVEASVRSLDEKDEPSIRDMVDRIVDARVDDGQLDDAELTLKNIRQIKEAFVQQLLGMYHTRIKYPDNVVPMAQHRDQSQPG